MEKMYRIDQRNRVTIPEKILKKINAKDGDYISYEDKNGDILIKKKIIRDK